MICILRPVHSRIEDVHTLWHEALANYHNPSRFRTFLNACIEASRNVTFVLQKLKADIPEFDAWYGPWRVALANDPVLRWIVEARNRVVKEGDLDTASLARVSVRAQYSKGPTLEVDVEPHWELEAIAALVLNEPFSDQLRKHGVLVVERIWRVPALGERELLDALGHAVGRLNELLIDAHLRVGLNAQGAQECVAGGYDDEHTLSNADHRPHCMIGVETGRSIAIHLGSGQQMTTQIRFGTLEEGDKERVEERYGTWPQIDSPNPSMRELAEVYFSQARVMLIKDGFHLPFAFLFSEDNEATLLGLASREQHEKPLIAAELRRQVHATRAHTVMFIGESWSSPFESVKPGLSPEDVDTRHEVLDLTVISRRGESFSWVCPILRTENGIELGPREEMRPILALYIRPVLAAWAEWDNHAG